MIMICQEDAGYTPTPKIYHVLFETQYVISRDELVYLYMGMGQATNL